MGVINGWDWQPRAPTMRPLTEICAVRRRASNGSIEHRGTGTLIAPRLVLTAAHVADVGQPRKKENGAWIAQSAGFHVLLALNGDQSLAGRKASSIILFANGVVPGSPDDFALCVLSEPLFSEQYPRPKIMTDTIVRKTRITGYPQFPDFTYSDGNHLVEGIGIGTVDSLNPYRLIYESDTATGHSGSPVFFDDDFQFYHHFAGIHVADQFQAHGNYNMGLRFQESHLSWISFFEQATHS